MPLKAVIFDMDGVIIDSHPAHKEAWKAFLASCGKSASEADLDIVLDGRKREEIIRHFFGDLEEGRIRHYGELKNNFFMENVKEVSLISGFLSFLQFLSNHEILVAVATSAHRSRALHHLEMHGLTAKFRVVVAGNEVSAGKPDPAIFQLAAEKLGVEAISCLVVEDAVSGVRAAKAAGMKCLALSSNGRGESLRLAGADLVADDYCKLDFAGILSV